MIIEYFYSHKSSPLYLITRSATVAAMAESVSTWCMRTSKTDSVGRVTIAVSSNNILTFKLIFVFCVFCMVDIISGISSIAMCTLILKLMHTHIQNYNQCSFFLPSS